MLSRSQPAEREGSANQAIQSGHSQAFEQAISIVTLDFASRSFPARQRSDIDMIKLTDIIHRYWIQLSALILLAITALSLSPLENLPETPGSDKTHHLIAYAALAFPTAIRKPKQWQAIIIIFALYGGLIELLQPHVNRYGEWMDCLANISGLLIGIMLAFSVHKLAKPPQ